ncbi:MAG: 4-hydroxy-tetrahydrodipicolinate reductase [Desulfovibrionaceae bacterium]|nr:4-hydroxy-tetrahydrodipicolinate reductase [Desulfovibrionaceae bacterium]
MGINVVLTGADGRMGRTLHAFLEQDVRFQLKALVVLPSELEKVRGRTVLPVFSEMEEALEGIPTPVIIDFTAPEASLGFARIAAMRGAALVTGSTGMSGAQQEELAGLALRAPILWSPNMSLGIAALVKILPDLIHLLGAEYDVEILEMHHRKKKDSPSGTALRLGECVAAAQKRALADCACYHREGLSGERPDGQIGLQTIRGGDVVGVHTVYLMGPGERIELTHQAHSRENFAQGALRAAAWLAGRKPGKLYGIQDALGGI